MVRAAGLRGNVQRSARDDVAGRLSPRSADAGGRELLGRVAQIHQDGIGLEFRSLARRFRTPGQQNDVGLPEGHALERRDDRRLILDAREQPGFLCPSGQQFQIRMQSGPGEQVANFAAQLRITAYQREYFGTYQLERCPEGAGCERRKCRRSEPPTRITIPLPT